MFGIDFGSRIIGAIPSTIANQYVMLSGEGGLDLGCPNMLTLPVSIHQPAFIATMTIERFSTNVTSKGTALNYPLLARSNASYTTKLPQIAPIPPFLIYEWFDKDIYAAEFIERVLSMNRDRGVQDKTLYLQQFLLSLLSSHNVNNPNPYVNSEIMMQTPSADAKKWVRNQFARLFPSLQEAQVQPTPPSPDIS